MPWVGGNELRTPDRRFWLSGPRPTECGWHRFRVDGTKVARWSGPAEPTPETLIGVQHGYLFGDRFIPEAVSAVMTARELLNGAEAVYCIPDALDRFCRISAGRPYEGGSLVFRSLEMPLGSEDEVSAAFLDQAPDVRSIAGVTPALDALFRLETWQRAETARVRAEQELRRQAEEAARIQLERRQQLMNQIGTSTGRREIALVDFAEAAKAALSVSGAVYLDHRPAPTRGEMIVKYRYSNRRFECVCNARTLRITDAGICLKAEYDQDGFEEGTRGDSWFTLESLPTVVGEAIARGQLVVFRHV